MKDANSVILRVFHFTCDHGRQGIGTRGEIRPMVEHPMLHCKVSWFTTEGKPDRESTGLSNHYTTCDRMKYRYVVTDLLKCEPWLTSQERLRAPEDVVQDLERYGDPEHWYISTHPVKARLG